MKCLQKHYHHSQDMNQTKYLPVDEWVEKMWYVDLVEHYTTFQNKDIISLHQHEWTWGH